MKVVQKLLLFVLLMPGLTLIASGVIPDSVGYITGSTTNFRDKPARLSQIITRLYIGRPVKVTHQIGVWL